MDFKQVLKEFHRDVENHTMKVLKEDGIYKHLKFSRNGSSTFSFDILTWEGYLCITGDMGCQVFKRLPDMFNFFRSDNKEELEINPDYWSEKSEACDDIKTFNKDTYKNSIEEFIESLKEDYFRDDEEELENAKYAEDIYEAVEAIRKLSDIFSDIHEYIEFEDYSYRYVWRLYAIVWGIQKYDEFKKLI